MSYEYQFATDETRRINSAAASDAGGGLPAYLQLLEVALDIVAVAGSPLMDDGDTPIEKTKERELFRTYAENLCKAFVAGEMNDTGE
jgi:hypothetical protein